MAQILYDTFTDSDGTSIASHTPDSGGSWSLHTGTAGAIHSNRAHGGTNFGYYFHSQAATSDGESVTASLKLLPPNTTLGLLLRANSTSGGNFYMAFWQPDSLGALSFWRKVNGSLSQIKTGASFTAVGDHTMEFRVSGTGATVSLEVFFDGVSKDSYSDTAGSRITTLGAAGFEVAAATSTTGYHIDTITATDGGFATATSLAFPRAGRAHSSLITF